MPLAEDFTGAYLVRMLGLKPLRCDADMVSMVNATSTDSKNLVVIVDHVNFLANLDWNDVLVNGRAALPTMTSPVEEGKKKEINLKPFMKNLRPKKLDSSGQGTSGT